MISKAKRISQIAASLALLAKTYSCLCEEFCDEAVYIGF